MLPTIQMVMRPGMLDLAWGHPAPDLLPHAAIGQAAQDMLERTGFESLTYGADQGAGPLLEWLRERIERTEGRAVAANEILITAGNSDAIQQICALWLRKGDVVLVESPTYHLAVRILRDFPFELVPVAADGDGLRIDALEEVLAEVRRSGRRARMLYLVPTFHNPTGASLSLERRQRLVEIAAAEELLVLEDDVYRELAYDAPAPPSLWSLAEPGVVVRMGTFSKSLAPGLKLGWMNGGAELIGRLIESGVRDSGGGPSHFTAMLVDQFCRSGQFDAHVAQLRRAYAAQRDALLAGLETYMPSGYRVDVPSGGYFMWLMLPEGYDSAALLPKAEAAGVSYLPGDRFYLGEPRPRNALRLAFSFYTPPLLEEAARRLGSVVR
jgi:2-aminoadipate transaminase